MKIKTKTNYLLGILLSTFLIVWIINITSGETKTIIDTNPDASKLHTPSLFSLFLGNSANHAEMSVASWSNNLDILSGLIVWTNQKVTWSPKLSVIWWWSGNTIGANYAWIGGWVQNEITNKWENWAIWWWYSNKIWLYNDAKNWVIAWWYSNTDDGWWIILWWKSNKIASLNEWWIILWWQNNVAWNHSLILWSAQIQNPYASKYSFIWNQTKNEADRKSVV